MAILSLSRFHLRIAVCAAISISAAATAVEPVRADAADEAKIVLAATILHADRITGAAIPQLAAEEPEDSEVLIFRPPTHPSAAAIVPAANTTCDSAVVLKGRGFMYGIARGETPVLDHPHCRQ